ncbi:hypothetical protein K8I31_02405, partial [bacterium]|nr:hypothetical protein [bacterium]
ILPNSSVFWVLADFKQMRDHKKSFQDLWKEDAVQSVGNEFLSSLPSGATQTFQVLSGASEAMRLFILPPPREGKPMFWIAAFIGNNDALSSLLSDIPNAEKETKTFGPNQIDVIKTPMGEIAVKQDDELLWLSMAPEEMAGILNTPAPPELAEKPSIHEDALRRFPHVAVALFTNSAHTIPPGPGAPGMLPQMLSLLGSDAAYAVLHWPNGEGRLTAIAHSETAPPWTASWAPLKSFPFRSEDPTGMLEIAFRRPATVILADATDIAQGNVAPPVPMPMNGPGPHPPMNRDAKIQKGQNPPNRLSRAGMLDFYSMAKPDHIFSLNLFGFYKGSPAMAFAYPDFAPEGTLIDKFQDTPGVKPEDVEIANLPGTRFQFKEGKRRPGLPLNELIAIERDATMYLFDSDIA